MSTFYSFLAFASPFLSAVGGGKDLTFAVHLAKTAFQRPPGFDLPVRIDLHTKGNANVDAVQRQAEAAAILERVKDELGANMGSIRLFLWRDRKERRLLFGHSDGTNKTPRITWAVSATHVARPDKDYREGDRPTFSVLPRSETSRLASEFYSATSSKQLYPGSPFQQS